MSLQEKVEVLWGRGHTHQCVTDNAPCHVDAQIIEGLHRLSQRRVATPGLKVFPNVAISVDESHCVRLKQAHGSYPVCRKL